MDIHSTVPSGKGRKREKSLGGREIGTEGGRKRAREGELKRACLVPHHAGVFSVVSVSYSSPSSFKVLRLPVSGG